MTLVGANVVLACFVTVLFKLSSAVVATLDRPF